ncbi:MAG: RHS repeat-associated core domain-containing protein [Verrucomicrobiota bacterium]
MNSSLHAIIGSLLLLTSLLTNAADTAISNSNLYNNEPEACCSCIHMTANSSDLGSDQRLQVKTDGTYDAKITVTYRNTPPADHICPANVPFKVTANFMSGNAVISSQTQSGTVSTTADLTFTLSAADARSGDRWEFILSCTESVCEKAVLRIGQCESCGDKCAYTGEGEGGNGPPNDDISENSGGGFFFELPAGRSNGGQTSGSLTFYAPEFANPGRARLLASVPSNFTVTRNGNGLITSINTGAGTVGVTAADAALLSVDPNAFVVTHKEPGGAVYRSTTISFVTDGGAPRIRVDTIFEGQTTRFEQTQPTAGTYVLQKGRIVGGTYEALSQETFTKNQTTPGRRIYRRISADRATASSAWVTTSDIESTWEKQIYQWVQTKQVIDPTGAALTSTWSYYQPGDATGPGGSTDGLGRLKQHTSYDGSTEFHTYTLHGQTTISAYAGDPAGKTTTSSWNPTTRTMTETTSVGGNIISKSTVTYGTTTTTSVQYTSASGTLTTVTHFKPSGEDFGGKPIRTLYPDGTLTTYAYTRNAGGGFTTVTQTGATTNGTTVSKGMRSISTTNSRGTTILSKTEAIGYGAANGLVYNLTAVTSIDNLGRALTTAYHPTSATVTGEVASASSPAWTTTKVYSCCGVASETDMYGVTTYHAYDHLQRQIKSNRLGVTTETHYNGLTTETHRYAETVSASLSPALQGTSATRVSKSVSNITGTLQESWSPHPTSPTAGALIKSSTTSTTYQPATGLSSRSVTTTADNFSQTTDSFLDGRTASTYGDLSPAMVYEYSVNTTGEVSSQSYLNTENLKLETTSTQSDWAGRTLRMDYMDGAFATMGYNNKGQMVKSTDPDGVVTLMAYNTNGEQTINAIDLNRDGDVDYGSDTVQFSETIPALDTNSNPAWRSISKVWQPGDTSPTGGTIVSTSLSSTNGLSSSSQSIGVANPSTQLTVLSGNGSWTTTNTSPDGTKSLSTYTGGRMVSMASLATNNAVIESQSQAYDALNRPITSTHSRTGASTTNYLSNTSDVVKSVSDAGGRTTAFIYDVRGRQISVDAPNTPVDENNPSGPKFNNVTTTTYNPDSTVAETNGDQTYRVSHTYDYADRQISMTTYGTTTATTTWQYSPTRGFLLAKRDAADKGATYTYKASGRLATRTWARGITTTYSYDKGGRMISSNYSDSTRDISMSYDALGRQTTQSNGIATSAFAYNASNLQIDTETVTYNLPGKPAFTRVIDRSQDTLGRDTGWQLKGSAGVPPTSFVENSAEYQYSATKGRLETVRRGDIPVPQEFDYTYTANSNLIATINSPAHTVSNVYETDRDVLASKVNKKLDTTTVSSYLYTVNNYGQRTRVNTGGTAFTGSPSWAWGYNSKGEIIKANSSQAGFDRSYQYDGIGNRLKKANSLTLPASNNYTANALNQYSAIGSLTPVHDDDGNMTSGPLPANVNANSTLIWDGENRLIQAQVNSGATVSYVYDSQSRRIAETVGSATTVYIYDGWNPIAEYTIQSSQFTLHSSFIWGLDLSGSMQGAGGVGGLLLITDHSALGTPSYYPTYDGNGNVSEYLDSTGNTVAHYEYDPFGRTVFATGSKSNDFAHRFSTKPLDVNTGLYYYGYRYYDPETGRWPSRDPIQERGGVNLYGFVGNDGIGRVDLLGNRWTEEDANSGMWYGSAPHEPLFGLNKETAELRRTLKAELQGDCLAKNSNILEVIDKLVNLINNGITLADGVNDNMYYPFRNVLYTDRRPAGTLHELTHAWVDIHTHISNDYLYNRADDRLNEGMAYGMGTLYKFLVATNVLESDNYKLINCAQFSKRLKSRFLTGAKELDSYFGQLNDDAASSFYGGESDIKRLATTLGLKIDMKQYLYCLQQSRPDCSCELYGGVDAIDENDYPAWLNKLK